MSLHAFPTVCGQTLRALSRYPSRTAFTWPGGSLSYQGAIDLPGGCPDQPRCRHQGAANADARRYGSKRQD